MNDREGRIESNRMVAPGYFLMEIRLRGALTRPKPGQFIMLRIPGTEVFLRRPFGIYRYEKEKLTLMYRVVGKGTERLARAKENEPVAVLGPLGKGFHIGPRDHYIVVAGGIGIAGVHSLIETLGQKALILFGCGTKEELPIIEDLAPLKPMVSTMDGSYGLEGTVVDLLDSQLKSLKGNSEIFACGPEAMLTGLKKRIMEERIPCQVLVEERMACGLGLCFGCVRETIDETEPFKRVCKEGPVFDLWQIRL
ncbi:MAG TPA: dihydroorotate dehydrogenase electron transfer subunit [Syntrophorhabdaceae bacterium]|jgi:dihydroorotate dehydrogenase electron transfer subunit